MNKAEQKGLEQVQKLVAVFEATKDRAYLDHAAKSMGILVRSARTDKAGLELREAANKLGLAGLPEYTYQVWG